MPRGLVICRAGEEGFQWTKERVINLIEQYSNWPELWDKNNSDYKNKSVHHFAWKEIGRDMDVDIGVNPGVLETQQKMKYLISQFQREWRKVKSGKGTETEIKWPFYHHLIFLKDDAMDKAKSNKTKTKNTSKGPQLKQLKLSDTITTTSYLNTSTIQAQNSDIKEEMSMVDESEDNNLLTTIKIEHLEELDASNSTSISPQPMNSQMEESNSTMNLLGSKDEFDVFGEHVAWQIRNLTDKQEQALAKHKINTLLFEMEISQVAAQKDK